jgi:carboxypeptidase C (cathepsin A)
VFYENGPYHIKEDLTLTPNPYGWDAAGSIIYVDQVNILAPLRFFESHSPSLDIGLGPISISHPSNHSGSGSSNSWAMEGESGVPVQPINTGFSFSDDERDRVYDEETVSADMLDFLLTFLDAHPEFKGKDFYVTGESYAG